MRILGLNISHDASLCVLNDGEIEVFHKEERLSGVKKDPQINKSLYDVSSCQIDDIVVSGLNFHSIGNSKIFNMDWNGLSKTLKEYYGDVPITFLLEDHHLCHASNAFYNSGFDKSLIFVIDGSGSIYDKHFHECETVFVGSYPCNFTTLYKNFFNPFHSTGTRLQCDYEHDANSKLGITTTYCTATTLIGQHVLENGKTMGLSVYGRDLPFENLFENDRPRSELFAPYDMKKPVLLVYADYKTKQTNHVNDSNYQLYADYAYQVQRQTEQQVLKLVSKWVEKTGITKVCITGGYGLNVVCNELLVRELPHVTFFFEPLADDTGNSIGAAKLRHHQLTNDSTIRPLRHTFFNGRKQTLKTVGDECSIDDVAALLQAQKTVAVFNGLAEAGPRALGNRSILFDARNQYGKEIMNLIKRREWYRPFAGIIMQEYFNEYFETHGLNKSEFMTLSFKCKRPECIPAVIHVDNTCRIQTVDQSIPHLYNLLSMFNDYTGCPVLMNTSFNMAGDPLIETQEQALNCLHNTELDALWFPEINRLVTK